MDKFFNILKKSLVVTVFLVFGFVATYTPLPYQDNIETADAVWANVAGQVASLVQQTAIAISAAATWALDVIMEWKESVGDGAAWVAAKVVLSSMLQSMLAWIQSGFEGRPSFVTDLEGFLLETADIAFGEYIDELGGIGSFLCEPFRLNIRTALSFSNQRSRIYQPAPTCQLTGIIDNITGFMDGTQGSFSQGGWNDWFDITSQPDVYTPFGSYLSAEAGAESRIANKKAEEKSLLNFGNGMFSAKECTTVTGAGGASRQECSVTTPGKMISEALSFNLDSGRQSLVAADEMQEVITSLISTVAGHVFSSAGDLLSA